MSTQGEKRLRSGWLQVSASVLVLAATLFVVGRGASGEWLVRVRLDWLALAAAFLLVQVPIMTARWRLFARRLAVPLGFRRALSEYFLATLLNQVLPLGVLGDVTRVVRHARSSAGGEKASYAQAALAVVLERASGQMGLWLVMLVVLPAWASQIPWQRMGSLVAVLALVAISLAATALGVRRLRVWKKWRGSVLPSIGALLHPRTLALHLPLSLVLVGLHIGAFLCIARAFGFDMSLGLAVRVVPPVLVATSLPVFLGGWGVREATMAGLYHAAGLASANGVSISVVYGVLSLLVGLPGLWALRPTTALRPLPRPAVPHEQVLR